MLLISRLLYPAPFESKHVTADVDQLDLNAGLQARAIALDPPRQVEVHARNNSGNVFTVLTASGWPHERQSPV